jgi:uncharacterized protein (TIGR02646 family)
VDLYHYPKIRHRRVYSPRVFQHYRSYKRWLQREFRRVCVYCREPDTYSRNLNFGVDHYRPKSIPRFATLECDYTNLYYCCSSCNSRKKADWPADEANGPYVVNPCDHQMADHIRFNAQNGEMEVRDAWGAHTRDLLQLNEPQTVSLRKSHLHIARLCGQEVADLAKQLKALQKQLAKGQIAQATYAAEAQALQSDISAASQLLDVVIGGTPLDPLRKTRLGVQVHP